MFKFSLFLTAATLLLIPQAYAAACPSDNFGVFFEKFVSDVNTQKAFTKVPLTSVHLKETPPLPTPVIESLGADQIKFPVIPNHADMDAQKSEIKVYEPMAKTTEVHLVGPGPSRLISYTFTQSDCWYLTKKDDQSFEGATPAHE